MSQVATEIPKGDSGALGGRGWPELGGDGRGQGEGGRRVESEDTRCVQRGSEVSAGRGEAWRS